MIQYSFVYVSVFYEYSHLTPFSQKQRMCKISRQCDGAMTRYRWRDRASLHCHSYIASSSSCHRSIALSYPHVIVIVIAPSRHRSIDPHSMVRWYDNELRGPIRIPYVSISVTIFFINFLNQLSTISFLIMIQNHIFIKR